jgi:uncharacterized protein (DUF2225 family)
LHHINITFGDVYLSFFWIDKINCRIKIKIMNKESVNVCGIKEFEGDGVSCPIIPVNLPWYKKVALTFFRFGVCPMCITMSLAYSMRKFFAKLFRLQ